MIATSRKSPGVEVRDRSTRIPVKSLGDGFVHVNRMDRSVRSAGAKFVGGATGATACGSNSPYTDTLFEPPTNTWPLLTVEAVNFTGPPARSRRLVAVLLYSSV